MNPDNTGHTFAAGTETNGNQQPADAIAHVDLQKRVEELEKKLAHAESECARYREAFRLWGLSQHTQEELREWAMNDDETGCLELKDFIHELEAIVNR